jgi:multidrug efflux system outer membrane protein
MHTQTDPVVNSILSDMVKDDIKVIKTSEGDLVIDTADTSQVENGPAVVNEDKLYEELLVAGSGLRSGAGAGGAGAGGTGTGSGTGAGGTGTGGTGTGSGTGGAKTDVADTKGGTKPDGTGPASTNNNPADSPDSPCAK